MPLSFLVPLFLAGLAALAIPLVVHLRHRERREPVRFPSLMFLRRIPFREEPLGSAAFVVLKSPDMPSVLFESGYISSASDAARLLSPEGRQAFAEATAEAVRIYFARQSVR